MATPQRYVAKPYTVEACLVAHDNMQKVADWCYGSVVRIIGQTLIAVPSPTTVAQWVYAFVGQYILRSPRGFFEVWTAQSFKSRYEIKK